ncbi:toll/interleukin-1 receptor domain-containing protein [Streptomyces sp. NPDC087859]|uniref:toll/interleukin-1 receptor domain-containing protein n=1 Tax=Streptomyces sp. NPDC087859 TaxID=3365812 RepID=UPI0038153596
MHQSRGADRAWVEWAGWHLMDAGYQVELDDWDWGAGDNFKPKMNAALERGRLLTVRAPPQGARRSLTLHSQPLIDRALRGPLIRYD